jgi:hypothetical protein
LECLSDGVTVFRALCTQTWDSNRKHLLKRVVRQDQEAFYKGKTNTN